jgi:tetratricopeptide (TPR) repeat protein
MKKIMIAAALAGTTIGFAQRREFKKIEKAVENKEYKEAETMFAELPISEIEDDYKDDYEFYKGVFVLGDNPSKSTASIDDLEVAFMNFEKAEELGFDKSQVLVYKAMVSEAMLEIADKKSRANDNEGALVAVTKLLKIDPTNDYMKLNVADLSYRTEDYTRAVTTYQELLDSGFTGSQPKYFAIEKSSGEKKFFSNLKSAELSTLSSDYSDAGTEYEDSKLGSIVTNTVWLYKNAGEKEKAEKVFSEMRARYPSDTSLTIASADIYLILGMMDEYEKAVKSMNAEINDPQVFENLAVSAAEKENWDQAIDYYQKSLDLKEDNFLAQNNIAVAYINKGNLDKTSAEEQKVLYTKATTHFEKVLELKPEQAGVVQTLVGLYEFLDMKEKAAAMKAKM